MITAICSMPPMRVRGYIVALPHVAKRQIEEFAFRSYVADCLRVQANGKTYENELPRWIKVVNPKPQDTRTAGEIVMDIITHAGLKFQGQGGEAE